MQPYKKEVYELQIDWSCFGRLLDYAFSWMRAKRFAGRIAYHANCRILAWAVAWCYIARFVVCVHV
jgi:hypothetical protein